MTGACGQLQTTADGRSHLQRLTLQQKPLLCIRSKYVLVVSCILNFCTKTYVVWRDNFYFSCGGGGGSARKETWKLTTISSFRGVWDHREITSLAPYITAALAIKEQSNLYDCFPPLFLSFFFFVPVCPWLTTAPLSVWKSISRLVVAVGVTGLVTLFVWFRCFMGAWVTLLPLLPSWCYRDSYDRISASFSLLFPSSSASYRSFCIQLPILLLFFIFLPFPSYSASYSSPLLPPSTIPTTLSTIPFPLTLSFILFLELSTFPSSPSS